MTTTTRSPGAQALGLAGFAAAVTLAAVIGALGVPGTESEYANLDQPSWAPPSEVFGPVWTVLYATIAISGWLVWRSAGWSWPLGVYTAQLVLNAAWTPLFFGAGRFDLAMVDITLLWILIGLTIFGFWRLVRSAALLLVPYWMWVTFAAALNWSIWRLNP